MEIEKDYIKREIQKLNLILVSLIDKISGINSSNANNEISSINEVLEKEFDLTLEKISNINTTDLIKHISTLHESHIEKIVKLLYQFVVKIQSLDLKENYELNKTAEKGIIIIEFLNQKSKLFSVERMNMKKTLQLYL
ncbi:hypothetical protein [Aequorivita xiaoshiensis]|uniref:Uncharacterized protein n=1 Tax=Aequorivita xiaoshiensis TaxID=2874476 RepID=A0A9X1R3V4_9FLAO|nr:hypothetical protein [Aequorivita xiaoshiensis]MCG2431756.1 hypothetical protein [Aequorivita xiaoshiensis]